MSQTNSTYERKPRDFYATPEWVTETLLDHLPPIDGPIWEPACGDGKMVKVLEKYHQVLGTDIHSGDDFLSSLLPAYPNIITNPPYKLAEQFVRHALTMTRYDKGLVAMLLSNNWDTAKTRRDLFTSEPFLMKLVLTKRIAWFVEDNGKPKASPSENHAWYVWDHRRSTGQPFLRYSKHE